MNSVKKGSMLLFLVMSSAFFNAFPNISRMMHVFAKQDKSQRQSLPKLSKKQALLLKKYQATEALRNSFTASQNQTNNQIENTFLKNAALKAYNTLMPYGNYAVEKTKPFVNGCTAIFATVVATILM